MCADEVRPLLHRFTGDASRAVPPKALWAHGSLARGDFQPDRSDRIWSRSSAPADEELAEYIRADLRDFWHSKTSLPKLWWRDIWVDLGLLTLARATVTLQQGRLITKKEALEVLAEFGTPADVLRDIYRRRYETPSAISPEWRAQRGFLARTYVRAQIERVLELPDEAAG